MTELTREDFTDANKIQAEQAQRHSDDQLGAFRELAKEIRHLAGSGSGIGNGNSNGNGNGHSGGNLVMGLLITVMLTLFGTCITIVVASHMIFSAQITNVVSAVSNERLDRIAQGQANQLGSKERHKEANESSIARHLSVVGLIEADKTDTKGRFSELRTQLARIGSYHDEIIRSKMRWLAGEGGGPKKPARSGGGDP